MLALDGICATLGARDHEGPLTDTVRVRKRDGVGPRSKEMAFFLVLACDERAGVGQRKQELERQVNFDPQSHPSTKGSESNRICESKWDKGLGSAQVKDRLV